MYEALQTGFVRVASRLRPDRAELGRQRKPGGWLGRVLDLRGWSWAVCNPPQPHPPTVKALSQIRLPTCKLD
jgi:hypothetical protein